MPMDQLLYVAAKEGNMEVLEQYKDKFATQLTPYNNTVLHVAAQRDGFNRPKTSMDFLDMVRPDLYFSLNCNGDTFIHMAARNGNLELIKAFINYTKNCGGLGIVRDIEADIQKLLSITNNDGNTALHEAVMHGRCSDGVVELLVKEDAGFSYPPNKAGKSPLYLAVERGDNVSVELILNNCASPSYAGPNGATALHAVVMHPFPTTECLEMIVKKEGTLTKQVDEFAWNSLHFAAYFGYAKIVKQLLVADREMAYKTIREYNMTPLHLAAINDNQDVVEEILNQCPDSLEAVTSQGQNLLHLAYSNKENSKIRDFLGRQHLLQNLIDQKDADGNTPFHAKGKIVLYHPRLEEIDLNRIRHTSLREEMLRECMEVWKERANTHLIVATLIATVSFAAGFTIPGGYNGDDGPNKGMAILWKKAAFQVFAVADTFAMTSSTSAMFLHYLATYEQETKRLNRYVTAGILVLIAMVAMMVAFMTGLYVVLPSSSCVAVSICFICSITLISLIFSFGKNLSDSFSEFSKYYC